MARRLRAAAEECLKPARLGDNGSFVPTRSANHDASLIISSRSQSLYPATFPTRQRISCNKNLSTPWYSKDHKAVRLSTVVLSIFNSSYPRTAYG